ncbi:MAG: IclR family transcriptional regulator C-terminal domain-containing protein [Erythrobacter sp.]|uniref:IclR family transcriptional regulator domain-containing protein n=1 Tax=Erythrobacter sp. TaxID=1042 RepID=UPI003265300E
MAEANFDRGVPIRAISRGLSVLKTVNRIGPISMMEISRASEVPYPTACRIVQTLIHEGMIEREPARKRYRVTGLVQTLSTGYQAEDALVNIARDHLVELTEQVNWPISLATRVGTSMMVRDSTHGLTSLTFTNYYPGYTLPISECASGKAYIAHCGEAEREAIIEGWRVTDNDTSRVGLVMVGDNAVLNDIRAKGHAVHNRNTYTVDAGKTSSIAVPILRKGQGEVAGTLTLIYFASAMDNTEAARKYLNCLQEKARDIARELDAAEAA